MNCFKKLLSVLAAAAILLALPGAAYAMGFDAEEAYEAVFVVYSGDSLGSGFALGENCIVTNAHVVDSSAPITVVSYDESQYDAVLFGISREEDIAVLLVDGASFPCLSAASTADAKPGDDVYVIGAPKGMAYTLTKGSISAKARIINGHSYVQLDAPINEGNSGGPLLNDAGQVLGMNALKLTDSEGIGLAIPIERICAYLESLSVTLDEAGRVSGALPVPAPTSAPVDTAARDKLPVDTRGEARDEGESAFSPVTLALIAVAALSLAGNVVLTIMLIYQKKKNLTLLYNPKERTDFDIDVWD